MPELIGKNRPQADRNRSVRLAGLARRQHGVVSVDQLRSLGFSPDSISGEAARGRLIRVHPRVYAVGHSHLDLRGRLFAALLYVGSGAALSHTTAAWWWALISSPPSVIHISAPRDVESLRDVIVHRPRRFHVVTHSGVAVTAVGRTLVDTASMLGFDQVRKMVAQASFLKRLTPPEAVAALRRGRKGSAAIRRALAQQLPELAKTLSPLEDLFVVACDAAGLPAPQMNRMILGFKVDAIWPDHMLAVELDGGDAHGHPVAVHTDRSRDLRLRQAGWIILRYSRQQIENDWPAVLAELRSYLAAAN